MVQPYRRTYTVCPQHLDCFGRLKASALLYFIQEISGEHAAQLDAGWDTLQEKHLFWAIIRHRVQITRLPEAGETITLETWPMPTTRVAYPRATAAYDAGGNELFRSHAMWVLMDTESRAMVLPGKSGVPVDGILLGNEPDAPVSLLPKQLVNVHSRAVARSDLDKNRHMNKTRYLDWIDDLLPDGFRNGHCVKEISVCYLSEAREEQLLELRWELADDLILRAEAHRENTDVRGGNERIFAAQLRF